MPAGKGWSSTHERWGWIEERLASATVHLGHAKRLYRERRRAMQSDDDAAYDAREAYLKAAQNAYTSIEECVRRLLRAMGESLPDGPDWHSELLLQARLPGPGVGALKRPPVISEDLHRHLDELRKFRHVALHAYDRFDADKAAVAHRSVVAAAKALRPEIEGFALKVGLVEKRRRR